MYCPVRTIYRNAGTSVQMSKAWRLEPGNLEGFSI